MADIRVINIRDADGTGPDLEGNIVSLHAIWMDWLLKPDDTLDETEELVNIVKVALLNSCFGRSRRYLTGPRQHRPARLVGRHGC